MIDPFDYPDEVLFEVSDPDWDRDSEDRADYEEEFGLPLKKNVLFPKTSVNILGAKYTLPEVREVVPTKCTSTWWLTANSRKKYKENTKDGGKWLCFCPPEFIDAAWEQISDATQQGLLGGRAKCSTRKGWKGGDNEYVICIYSYNWKDTTDVMRIREELRELGFTKPMSYKTDADTKAKKYAGCGQKIAKYYE